MHTCLCATSLQKGRRCLLLDTLCMHHLQWSLCAKCITAR